MKIRNPNRWLNLCHFGDVRSVLHQMIADGVQVDTIVTSPPYWGLRSYLAADHPDKKQEIGSEPTLSEFLAGMVEVFGLARQVLKPEGTAWVNMGDSYAGSWGSQGREHSGLSVSAMSARQVAASQRKASGTGTIRDPGIKPKDLVGQPWRLAFALQDAGWWLRQDIIWAKPNPMPESIKDRCTKAHEYLFLLAKSERYYFDQDAIREPALYGATPSGVGFGHGFDGDRAVQRGRVKGQDASGFKNASLYDGKHAGSVDNGRMTAAAAYVRRPAGWADSGSKTAADWATEQAQGRGSRRNSFARATKYTQGEHGQKPQQRPDREDVDYAGSRNKRSVWTVATEAYPGSHFATFPRALIEPCILAGAPTGGIVLDPFFGSGTTGQVAQQLGRQFIGIDLNRANEPLQYERLRQLGLAL